MVVGVCSDRVSGMLPEDPQSSLGIALLDCEVRDGDRQFSNEDAVRMLCGISLSGALCVGESAGLHLRLRRKIVGIVIERLAAFIRQRQVCDRTWIVSIKQVGVADREISCRGGITRMALGIAEHTSVGSRGTVSSQLLCHGPELRRGSERLLEFTTLRNTFCGPRSPARFSYGGPPHARLSDVPVHCVSRDRRSDVQCSDAQSSVSF